MVVPLETGHIHIRVLLLQRQRYPIRFLTFPRCYAIQNSSRRSIMAMLVPCVVAKHLDTSSSIFAAAKATNLSMPEHAPTITSECAPIR